MPNVMGVLRAEIRRLARKETKDAVRDLKRQVAALRRRLAMTKKRMNEVERAAQRAGSVRAAAAAPAAEEEGGQIRFSPRWVRVHRSRLGMSRRVYAKLVGVSPQTILLWEQGKARPRRSALATWRELRGKGIRELKAAVGGEASGAGRGRRPKKAARRGRPAKPRAARGARKGRMARAARRAGPKPARAGRKTRSARAKKK